MIYFNFFFKTDKEGIESQEKHQQESLKGRITLPSCNKSLPDNVSIINNNIGL